MSRSTAATLLLTPAMALSLLACQSGPPPCTTIGKPSEAEIAAAAGGAEIEREVQGSFGSPVECVVVGDTWVDGATLEEED